MKVITFAVPCYNSAGYMSHCIDTLLEGGEDVEIILVDDGSTDDTGAIADRYAAEHPDVIRVIHQENGGHGEGVNQGIRNATGVYYKVVDSDDWLDVEALHRVMEQLRIFARREAPVDMVICNYVYEHVADNTQKSINYRNIFPVSREFSWEKTGWFRPSQYLLMHSVIYRTQLLRDCGLELPRHTFYVDNIFVYQPLPYVKSMFYMDEDLYRYFIGRSDQSVNEQVMVRRVDQQLRVTRQMIKAHRLEQLQETQPKLGRYMRKYMDMMMTVSSIFLIISGTAENLQKKKELWKFLQAEDPWLYRRLRYHSLSMMTNFPGYQGRRLSVGLYRIARKVYKFN